MLLIQILLNNLLYDISESIIPTDCVDLAYTEKPKRWNINFIRKFIIIFGPVSSMFDFLTFFILIFVFKATEGLFQTAWFIESLSTQILVISVIRTRIIPFYHSRPSWPLLASSILIIATAFLLPYTILEGCSDLFILH
jgi:Mg2+-importing ATPase